MVEKQLKGGQTMNEIYRARIRGFAGHWGSGIGYLLLEDCDSGIIERIPCENAPTVRALESCFGNVIGEGHTVKVGGNHVGQEIFWSPDEIGLLAAFTPVENASQELLEAYNQTQEEKI